MLVLVVMVLEIQSSALFPLHAINSQFPYDHLIILVHSELNSSQGYVLDVSLPVT